MQPINMLQATTQLSRLVETVEQVGEREIDIARNSGAVMRLIPVEPPMPQPHVGLAKGYSTVADDLDHHSHEMARLILDQGAAP